MRASAAAALAALVLAGCGAGETVTVTETKTVATTETVTATETAAAQDPALPPAVADTRAALLEAAETGDYEQLAPLVPERLHYTFGDAAPGGAISHWQEVERETGDSPIRILAGLLRLPHAYFQGVYVWPFAFPYASADLLTDEDRALLRDVGGVDLAERFIPGTGYAGWRVGIDDDGTWLYFVAGD